MARPLAAILVGLLVVGCGMAVPPPASPAVSGSPAPADASPGPTEPPTASPPPAATPTPGVATPTRSPFVAPPASEAPPAATTRPGSSPATVDRWRRAGRFSTFREDTQLVLLGSGLVLAAGSEPTCGIESTATDSAELWSPRRSRWAETDDVPSKRTITTLIGLVDGRAMITGGANQQYVAKSSTAVFDPATRRWTVSGLLDTARMHFASAPLQDGGVLVAGGLLITASQGGHALRSAEVWNPATGRWRTVRPMSVVRTEAVAVTLTDGRVLVVGGFPTWGDDTPLRSAELYDPATGRWKAAGQLSARRQAFTMVALPDGGALVVGGRDGETTAERFDPASRTWSAVAGRAPAGVRPAVAVLRDGRVLVVSGKAAKLFHPATGRWRRTASLPGGMWDASAVLLKDGSVLVGGGWTQPAYPGDTPGCEGYDNRTWRFIPGT